MSTTTTNLGLTLPDDAEGYDIDVVNANNEAIDEAVGTLQAEIGGGTTSLSSKIDDMQEDVDAIDGKADALQLDVTDIKTKATATNTTVGTINANVNTINSRTNTTNTTVNTINSTLDTVNDKIDTVSANVSDLGNSGVKRVYTTNLTSPSGTNVLQFSIPSNMNSDKVVINLSSGVRWTRSGNIFTIVFEVNTSIGCQLIEYY